MKAKKIQNAELSEISKSNNTNKKAIEKEYKTLASRIKFIADTDSPECEDLRKFWSLRKKANLTERKAVEQKIIDNFVNYRVQYFIKESGVCGEECEISGSKIIPCTSTGKIQTNYLTAIYDAKIRAEQKAYLAAEIKKHTIDGVCKLDELSKKAQTIYTATPKCWESIYTKVK